MPLLLSLSTLVSQNKKVLQHGAYLPRAQVISAFSFFVSLLEFPLREQKAAKVQFLRTAWYATIIKSQYLGFTKQKRFWNKVRTFLQLRWFLLFLFSLVFWSFFYENKKQRKVNFSEALDMPPLYCLYRGFTKQKGSATKYVPSCDSGDFCFFLFPFFFGVSAMNLKSNEVFSFMPCESVSKNSPRSMYQNCNMAPRL